MLEQSIPYASLIVVVCLLFLLRQFILTIGRKAKKPRPTYAPGAKVSVTAGREPGLVKTQDDVSSAVYAEQTSWYQRALRKKLYRRMTQRGVDIASRPISKGHPPGGVRS